MTIREQVRGDTSDGHHTFDELYDYRMLYNAHAAHGWLAAGIPVVKSWHHSDGELCFGGGWFIVTATLPSGQVSNHYQAEHWDLFIIPAVDIPPAYDGHTPTDAANRLRTALTVFEKAHAPTDDEREALAEIIEPFDFHGTEPVDAMADAILVAGFRRPVFPEPREYLDCGRTGGGCDRIAEPSAELNASEHPNELHSATANVSEVAQGEPTDTQVLAALNARDEWMHTAKRGFEPAPELDGYFAPRKQGAMRAALRAAAEVKGENRG